MSIFGTGGVRGFPSMWRSGPPPLSSTPGLHVWREGGRVDQLRYFELKDDAVLEISAEHIPEIPCWPAVRCGSILIPT